MRSKNTDLMNEIKKFAEEYYLEYWKSPSTSEIAGAVGVTRATVYRYLIDMAERGMIDYDGSEIKTDVTRKYTDPGNNAVMGALMEVLPSTIYPFSWQYCLSRLNFADDGLVSHPLRL